MKKILIINRKDSALAQGCPGRGSKTLDISVENRFYVEAE